MRFLVVILALLSIGAVAAAIKHDTIDIDVTTIKPAVVKGQKAAFNSGDDDDDDGSGHVMSDDGSGSGSGQPATTAPTTKAVEARVFINKGVKTTENPTQMPTEPTTKRIKHTNKPRETEMTTEKYVKVKTSEVTTEQPSEKVVTIEPKKTTTSDNSMLGGGVSKDGDMSARRGEEQALAVLTNEVIAAVVVGGVCAIILIAFLVYRLRKRDEGSYILTDTGYKDTNKLRGDTGKEAFV